jgi:hypothetical protein
VVAGLLEGLCAIRDELDKRLSALAYLRRRNMISEACMDAALSAIRRHVLLGEHHPIIAEWDKAFKGLTRNPDAGLPQ